MNFVISTVSLCLICVLVVLTVAVAVACFKRKNAMARSLGVSGIACCVAVVSYFFAMRSSSEICLSIGTTFYLISVDVALVCFLSFVLLFSKFSDDPWKVGFVRVAIFYVCFETMVYFVNIFYPIAIDFPVGGAAAHGPFDRVTVLYWAHVVFRYALIVAILVVLFRQSLRIPKQFGRQYIVATSVLAVILAVNIYGDGFGNGLFDYSIVAYCIMVLFMFWYAYKYSVPEMLNAFKTNIFDNIEQAIVLFDYSGRMVLRNERALQMFSNIKLDENLDQAAFVKACNITFDLETGTDVFSFQCNVKPESVTIPLRCNFRRMRDRFDKVLGTLFVFSDAVLETDNLTSFQDWESFKLFATNNKHAFTYPMMAVVCDINNLSVINSVRGHNAGDRIMRDFAKSMKENFPQGTYFVRGLEAELIALSYGMNPLQVSDCIDNIRANFDVKFLYAIEEATEWTPDIMAAIESARHGLRQKKLLDKDTMHSEMLASLVKSLQKCDSDMEARVRRTQKMCESLGRRIGLTDRQQSDLSLLCLLYDVGKIAIPMEILNKPGKLTDREWKVMQGHVEKGFQIAKSSKDLAGVADLIRHHHERWDGKGYPDGLSRESIPLLSRVICVVDSFDAMVNDRPYRKGMSADSAMTELMRCAGSQFDPFLVSEFLPICQMFVPAKREDGAGHDVPLSGDLASQGGRDREVKIGHVHGLCYSRYAVDSELKIVEVDDNFEKLTGYSREDVAQQKLSLNELIPQEDITEFLCLATGSIANRQEVCCEHRITCKDGGMIYVFCYGWTIYGADLNAKRTELVITNSSDSYAMKAFAREEKEKSGAQLRRWEESFRRDSLTDLLNHAAFRNDVEQKLLEKGVRTMFLMLDLDKFKEYNDSFGHHAGDELLVSVANALRHALRGTDLPCRMGGDEFAAALFFEKGHDTVFMTMRAQQIFDRILSAMMSGEHPVSLSMGVAIADDELCSFNKLYEAADKALYVSKENGRGKMSVYSDSAHA
ncbi:MAG: diguanylate cyclase [Fibrobacter sp.]|uniref:diguanylate cyclase domain-containing protein n=1 Tax=Fibrobacter sp. TaxID=35828 RepID=UPI001B0AA96D|nr:diguanylate cyclase [Fibrobacter sp.]MBO7062360.1 diguanylate cyclase [Fibrobacter sp.]MBO7104512.1 diguanylate cyclase [Fibrobacter sp.]